MTESDPGTPGAADDPDFFSESEREERESADSDNQAPTTGDAVPAGEQGDQIPATDRDASLSYDVEYVESEEGVHRIVTRRTTRTRDVETTTEETITEVIPVPYQGPRSDQPRPVG